MPRANRIPIELNLVQRSRFWSKVNGYGSDGCWLWSGRVDGFGYGHFKIRKHSLKAHRVAWTLKRGAIPAGMTVDHLCRVPACVNPQHLELVTNKENILRGESPTAVNATKTHCPRGHEFSGYNLVIRNGSRWCRECERVHQKTNGPRYAETRRQKRAQPPNPSAQLPGTPSPRDAESSSSDPIPNVGGSLIQVIEQKLELEDELKALKAEKKP